MKKLNKAKLISMLNKEKDIETIVFSEKDLRYLNNHVKNESEFIVIKKESKWNV